MYNEMMGTKLYIIPTDQENREDLLNADHRTKEDLRERHRMYVNSDWECNTISTVTIEVLVKILHSHIQDNGVSVLDEMDSDRLNFYDLIEVAASNKKNEEAEKVGNINVKFFPGARVEDIVSDDVPRDQKEVEFIELPAAYSYPDDDERTRAMKKIDKIARKLLADKYSIMLPQDFMAISVTAIFLENLYRGLVDKVVLQAKPSVTINFNDIIEFHATKTSADDVDIRLRPGMGAKLIIKSDEATEMDDDE